MAVSIGPSDQRLSLLAQSQGGLRPNQTRSVSSVAVGGSLRTQESASSQISTRAREERSASSVLFSASSAVALRSDAVSQQEDALRRVSERLSQAENDANPVRRAELETEAQDILSAAQAQFAASLAEDPELSNNSVFTAILNRREGENAQVASIAVPGAPSLAAVGVSAISFADPAAARAQIGSALNALSSVQSSLQSASTSISQTVQARSAAAEASSSVTQAGGAVQLAQQIAQAVGSLDSLSNVEQLDVENLLAESDASQSTADRNQARIPLTPLSLDRPSQSARPQEPVSDSQLDNVTLANRVLR